MKLKTIDCGNTSRRSRVPDTNKILPSLIPVNSHMHVKPTNDDPVLKYLPGLWKFKAMKDDVLEIPVLSPGLILH